MHGAVCNLLVTEWMFNGILMIFKIKFPGLLFCYFMSLIFRFLLSTYNVKKGFVLDLLSSMASFCASIHSMKIVERSL